MTTLTNAHIRRHPVEHRVTVMETPEDQHYYGRTYDCYPNEDGTITVSRGLGYDTERVPFMGMYLVEELDSEGKTNGIFELLTFQEFNEQLEELGDPALEYGVRAVGGSEMERHKDVQTARVHLSYLRYKYPLGKFEVISRPAGSDDEWTMVGR